MSEAEAQKVLSEAVDDLLFFGGATKEEVVAALIKQVMNLEGGGTDE